MDTWVHVYFLIRVSDGACKLNVPSGALVMRRQPLRAQCSNSRSLHVAFRAGERRFCAQAGTQAEADVGQAQQASRTEGCGRSCGEEGSGLQDSGCLKHGDPAWWSVAVVPGG